MEFIISVIALFIAFAILRGVYRAFRIRSREVTISQAVQLDVPKDFAIKMIYTDSGSNLINKMWDKMRERGLMKEIPLSHAQAYVLSCLYVDAEREGFLDEISDTVSAEYGIKFP